MEIALRSHVILNFLVYYALIEFIEGVSQFSVKGDKESKLRCKLSSKSNC